ncbi:MAG: glycogen-binding domain-containing protein [Candidatus Omnitrophica bacterium]|nr:glycogen-binding domain-containing protein [Candidatus Omnitrophota bacterium]MDD5574981.1 glycogen-binding domain-containing protein [Candidatus Omnitrophota bacterium]
MAVKKSSGSRQVEFKISAPKANRVGVAGDFNGWKPDGLTARKDKNGTWRATLSVPAGTYEYKFVVDGSWIVDPGCSRRTINSFGSENSVLVVR